MNGRMLRRTSLSSMLIAADAAILCGDNLTTLEQDEAFVVAAGTGHVDHVKEHLPNVDDVHRIAALIIAARRGRRDIVELMLQYSALKCNSLSDGYPEALMVAVHNGHSDIVKLITVADVKLGENQLCCTAMSGSEHHIKTIMSVLPENSIRKSISILINAFQYNAAEKAISVYEKLKH